MSGATPDLVGETVSRLLSAVCTFGAIEAAEQNRWAPSIWDPLAEAGFVWVGVSESTGGSGGSWFDAAAVLRAVGSFAAAVPVAETGVLSGWLLASANMAIPAGPTSVVPGERSLRVAGDQLTGNATVAWGSHASLITGLVSHGGETLIVALRPDQVTVSPGANMAGEPRDHVTVDVPIVDVLRAPAPAGVDANALAQRGSLTRSVMIAGALQSLCEMVIEYTHGRRQFGKPISAFQAVQHHIVNVAQCAARASVAADVAVHAMADCVEHVTEQSTARVAFAVSSARVICDEAARLATRSAHQAHGAMGVTREYPLHQLTRRLWSWPHEYGTSAEWTRQMGRVVHENGANSLFSLLVD